MTYRNKALADEVGLVESILRAVLTFVEVWWFATSFHAPWGKYRKPVEGWGYIVTPWWLWLVDAVTTAPAFAVMQSYGAWLVFRDGWPSWPLRVACDASDWWEERLKPYAVHYTWLPPDSGDPDEVGMHVRRDLLTYVRDEEGRQRLAQRPRMFKRGLATTTTGGPLTEVIWRVST